MVTCEAFPLGFLEVQLLGASYWTFQELQQSLMRLLTPQTSLWQTLCLLNLWEVVAHEAYLLMLSFWPLAGPLEELTD